jgi:hypothetical protein
LVDYPASAFDRLKAEQADLLGLTAKTDGSQTRKSRGSIVLVIVIGSLL